MSEPFRKKKQYGQNFLTNAAIPARIVRESGIDSSCGILEIGPGLGALTTQLAPVAAKVVAVEIDSEVIPPLLERLKPFSNVTVIEQDILQTDLHALLEEHFPGMEVCVCANLPYYITTPILMKLLEGKYGFRSITVMVQKEVAERLCAKSGSDGYGAITASVSYYASVRRLFSVPAGCFSPKPKVDSAVIRLDLYQQPPVHVESEELLFEVIKAAFLQRRKTLCNALTAYFPFLTKEACARILQDCGLRADIRGEMLSLEQFASLTNSLQKEKER
ncbi:MAG: 16S rRNA (adenine(1518)-N(6)/adenine(1519)-N(6))-dimethyltransferase RsmA [Oscillospiraceae bacterium]|nr:16S rRNA (adenine(1518)-N(6)/adenine(1519)-N(6))-dimethyltransferase RsmA [Oscillospiraceae bacterium]